jgi:hypothetical protein
LQLFADRSLAAEFVREVQQEDDLVLRLFGSRRGGGHERRETLAVGRKRDIPAPVAPAVTPAGFLSDHISGLSAAKESPFAVYCATMIRSAVSKNSSCPLRDHMG